MTPPTTRRRHCYYKLYMTFDPYITDSYAVRVSGQNIIYFKTINTRKMTTGMSRCLDKKTVDFDPIKTS